MTLPERQRLLAGRDACVRALHEAGWSNTEIGAAMGLQDDTVRIKLARMGCGPAGAKRKAAPKPKPKRKPARRKLPVLQPVTDRPVLVAGPGQRRDCAREDERGECSANTTAQYRVSKMPLPEAWHCPSDCRWYDAPRRGRRLADAGRGPGVVW